MYRILLVFSGFLLALVTAKQNVRCFDCDPTTEGACLNLAKFNTKTTACSDLLPTRTKLKQEIADIDKLDVDPKTNLGVKAEWECFTLYFENDGDDPQSGVYRGCVEKADDVLTSCEFLKEQLKDGTVTKCQTCEEDECNIHDVGNGGATLSFSVAVLLLNILISVFVMNF